MAVSVDFYIKNDDAIPEPLEDVVVTVFDPANQLQVAGQGQTDSDGRISFTLPGTEDPGKQYEVRLFKLGISFGRQKLVSIVEPSEEAQIFDVVGTAWTLPQASDPRLCRCTGRFLGLNGQPLADLPVFVLAKVEAGFQVPKVVDGNMVAAQKIMVRTDADGRVSVDLYRTGEYFATFANEEDKLWNLKVPDRSSVNLIDLIHPFPVSLAWNSDVAPDNSLALAVGEQVDVPVEVLFSDFEVFSEGIASWIRFDSLDTGIAVVVLSQDRAVIRGVAPGTCSISASCRDPEALPIHIPVPSLSSPLLSVTVT